MDSTESKDPTPTLKPRMINRPILLVIGGIAILLLFGLAAGAFTRPAENVQVMAVPLPDKTSAGAAKLKEAGVIVLPDGNLKAQPVPQLDQSSADAGTEKGADVSVMPDGRLVTQPGQASLLAAAGPVVIEDSSASSLAGLVLPAIALGIFGLLIYAAYDLLRLYLHYRISKERDDAMFP